MKHPNLIGLYDVISSTIKSSDFNVLEPDVGPKVVSRGRAPSATKQLGLNLKWLIIECMRRTYAVQFIYTKSVFHRFISCDDVRIFEWRYEEFVVCVFALKWVKLEIY